MKHNLPEDVPDDEEALKMVQRIVSRFDSRGGKNRLGRLMDDLGREAFRKELF